MNCFSLDFWENVCIMIVVIVGVWSMIQLLLPYLTNFLPAAVIAIMRIVFMVIIGIIVVVLIFALFKCLLGAAGGFHFLH